MKERKTSKFPPRWFTLDLQDCIQWWLTSAVWFMRLVSASSSESDSEGTARTSWYHWVAKWLIWVLPSFTSCLVNLRVKKGIRYLVSMRGKPFWWERMYPTSYSSSVSSDRWSVSTVSPISLVLLRDTSLSDFFFFFLVSRHFMIGSVPPPRKITVNSTIIRVAVTRTYLFSCSNSRWRLRAKAIAPRKPLNHMINWFFLEILCSLK